MKPTFSRAAVPVLAALTVLLAATAHAQSQVWLDKQVTLQPIIVRSTDGVSATANAGLELFAAETQKIWAQAGIEIKFNAFQYFNDSTYLNLDVDSNSLVVQELGGLNGKPWTTTGPTVINLFFVQTLGSGVLGYTDQSYLNIGIGNSVSVTQKTTMAIADAAFSLNRLDVIAHELGHALGLGGQINVSHDFFVGDGQPYNLMVSGGVRNSPTFIGNIYPDGAGLDRLTGTINGTNWGDDGNGGVDGGQIDRARRMTAVVANSNPHYYVYTAVPEPSTTAAIAGCMILAVTGFVRFRARSASKRAAALA